ncbi:MAG: DUF1592 domain-containing protein [Planctomycetota bacterium]
MRAARLLLFPAIAWSAIAPAALRAQLPELIETHCADCHSGDDPAGNVDLDAVFAPDARRAADFGRHLEAMARRVRARTMPPPADVEPLAADQRRALVTLLADLAPRVSGARVATMRRLTRRQYEHTVQALFGLRWQARDLLPDDATAHGFEGIGDVQNVSPLMFEKYLDAATDVAARVCGDAGAIAELFGERDLEHALRDLLGRAYRRPATDEEVAELAADHLALRERGKGEADARQALLRAVLASPSFLFRAERGRDEQPWRLRPHELAVRLSYMLVSGPPDRELRAAADDGSLLRPEVLREHARRLARSDDGHALAGDFATQWLSLRDVLDANADFRRFRDIWNRSLRPSMRDEVVQAFAYLVREDRSVLELIDADYTFVNATLAKHYGIPDVEGREFRRVELADRRRGGVLGAGAMLMATSYPLRTSPVKRGQWILTRLLDSPPPPPPPDAGTLPRDDKNARGRTLREQLEHHRRRSSCAACHVEMDALGFALENYDALGRWRDQDVNGKPIDCAAELPDGTRLDGPVALRDALLARADDFVRAFAKNLLVHGVGRDMLLHDEAELQRIVAHTRANGDRFSALLDAVVTSPLFVLRDPDHTP